MQLDISNEFIYTEFENNTTILYSNKLYIYIQYIYPTFCFIYQKMTDNGKITKQYIFGLMIIPYFLLKTRCDISL